MTGLLPLVGILMLVVLALTPVASAASRNGSASTRPVGFWVTVDDTSPGMGQRLTASAQLYDQYGRPVRLPGVRVHWTRSGPVGTVTIGDTTTDFSGSTRISLTAPAQYGAAFGVRASAGGLGISGMTPYLTTGAGPVAKFSVTQSGGDLPLTTAVAGEPLLVRVTAQDAQGHTATEYVGTVTITSTCFSGSVTAWIGPMPTASARTGRGMNPNTGFADHVRVTPTIATGGWPASLSVRGLGGITTMPAATVVVFPGSCKSFRVQAPSSATTGVAVGVTVTALDAYGNTATGYRGNARFTSTDPNATLPAVYTFTATDAGTHTFTGGVTFASTGSQTVTLTDWYDATATGTSGPVAVTSPAAAPYLYSLSLTQGPAAGGNSVTIDGRNLSGVTAVTFGARAATNVVFAGGNDGYGWITAVAPSGTGGVQVTVTTPGGTSNGVSYTYFAAPSLISLSRNSGSEGDSVILTGAGFAGAPTVSFGGTSATSVSVDSATQITATVPTGAGTVNVTVTTPGGTSNSLPFSYVH